MMKCLRLSFFTFVCATAVTLAVTPLSFFISLLVPDVFASYLILGLGILIGFWDSLKLADRSILLAIIFYSALTHTSHLILLIALGSIFAFVWLLTKRATSARSYAPPLVILALVLAGIVGQLAFSFTTRHTIHADPVQPPFVTARIIADGPGYQVLQKNCAQKSFVVCNYMDQL